MAAGSGESIADLGGLMIAYRAFHKSLEGKPAPASVTRKEEARVLVATDPYPLGQFRLQGAVSNMPEFQNAFGCGSDSSMVRPEAVRCRIW